MLKVIKLKLLTKEMFFSIKSNKISIVELFKDWLIELKGFKYQITLAVLLNKMKTVVK